jgi:hypothetical protein
MNARESKDELKAKLWEKEERSPGKTRVRD